MRLVVLISGSGSNLAALLAACAEGRIRGQVVGVVSDRRDAYGLVRAAEAGVPTTLVPWRLMHKAGASREDFDAALLRPSPPTPQTSSCSRASCVS